MALTAEGRLALRVEAWGPALDETAFRPLSLSGARDAVTAGLDEVALAGRLVGGIRSMGRVTFADLEDGSVIERGTAFSCPHLQLFISQAEVGPEAYQAFAQEVDSGDFVEVRGQVFFTRLGQISLRVRSLRTLTKALNPPPEKFHGLTDVEKRLRERYADLLANEPVRHRFRRRALIVRALRRFLDERGFLEVETPILQPLYGGAAAQPFVTRHHHLDQQLYLRISFELYLKRLLVGMYDKVYEIGRDFRNEGISRVHNPEFTQLELYQAYVDYNELMGLFEQMVCAVAQEVLGGLRIVYQGQEIDLAPPWPRVPLLQAIQEASGIDVEAHPDAAGLGAVMRERGVQFEPGQTWAKLVDKLLSEYVEPKLVQPTFLTDYPVELSPLAKRRPDRPHLVERFECFAVGFELCNAFSELNDPLDQEERFLAQGRDYEAGDEEAHPMDTDWLNALMYGMPPAGGLGMGVDRLVMLLTDQTNIREVILFPPMRGA
ncbi:MAG: lysine--tRNA ligase [Chloroflexia bacterium]|nr:lysine--tRNA ligase [Chloroflexia bacterium]